MGYLVGSPGLLRPRPAAFATAQPAPSDSGGASARCSGQRLQRQVGALVRDVLDLPCRVAEQLVSQVGQGPRRGDLLADLRDLLVIRVTAGKAVADYANAVPGQPRLGQ